MSEVGNAANVVLPAFLCDKVFEYEHLYNWRLIAPRKLLEARLFNQQYQNYEDIPNVQDRLRWCRHHMGLMQKEVSELIGITRGHYIDFEVGYVDHYPKKIVDKLAELYQIPVDDLLDDYNRFLYKGQGKMIRGYRESLGLKKKPFARLMGIEPNLLRAWEADQEQININSWNKYFKDKIKVHLLDQVFASFCDDADSLDFAFDNGQVCRWFNGQARISPRFPLPLVH